MFPQNPTWLSQHILVAELYFTDTPPAKLYSAAFPRNVINEVEKYTEIGLINKLTVVNREICLAFDLTVSKLTNQLFVVDNFGPN